MGSKCIMVLEAEVILSVLLPTTSLLLLLLLLLQ